nr:amidohydrolase family protein [Lachnospiraceae bacterium]
EQSLKENEEFITWALKEDDDMIKAMFGGHALFTISDRTFEKRVEMNNGRTGFHIHVAEGMNDVYDSMEKYGCLPVERLMYNKILGEKTLLGHCIHLSPGEMEIIKETGTMVVNNPESNMGNAVGCAPVLKMFEKGITVGMGTDAYTHDMLESLKVFLIIQRHNAGLPNVAWGEDVTMLFENNRKICAKYFKKPLGILQKGAAADVIVMDYPAFTPFSDENVDGHMIFGMEGHDCTMTMIDGKVLYRDRQFTVTDREKTDAFILEESKKLWGELNGGK